MSSRIVVADASPLIGLARIDRLSILRGLFETIYLPPAVIFEVGHDSTRPGGQRIAQALRDGVLTGGEFPSGTEDDLRGLARRLDPGEAEAIAMARVFHVAVLMDEKRGRRIAHSLGLTVIGTGAVLIAAKRMGLISRVAPCLADLRAQGYRLGDRLVRAILERCGETESAPDES